MSESTNLVATQCMCLLVVLRKMEIYHSARTTKQSLTQYTIISNAESVMSVTI